MLRAAVGEIAVEKTSQWSAHHVFCRNLSELRAVQGIESLPPKLQAPLLSDLEGLSQRSRRGGVFSSLLPKSDSCGIMPTSNNGSKLRMQPWEAQKIDNLQHGRCDHT